MVFRVHQLWSNSEELLISMQLKATNLKQKFSRDFPGIPELKQSQTLPLNLRKRRRTHHSGHRSEWQCWSCWSALFFKRAASGLELPHPSVRGNEMDQESGEHLLFPMCAQKLFSYLGRKIHQKTGFVKLGKNINNSRIQADKAKFKPSQKKKKKVYSIRYC